MSHARVTAGFWRDRMDINARKAIFHQWQQLEESGCIQNFRIAAGEAEGFREGWFFADSDAYKWLEAAARIQGDIPSPQLAALVDAFIALIGRAQEPDGYLFTYNQLHFPGTHWTNLQIEHELYCHGHLIEAGVSHYEATGRMDLLQIARKAADRIVQDFMGKGSEYTPGHEEIEIALLRLHEVMEGDTKYLEMARQFIEQRGRLGRLPFALSILKQTAAAERRGRMVKASREGYLVSHPGYKPYQLPPGNQAKKPADIMRRWYASGLTGKFFQQHAPVRQQTVPVGHSVRFGYLETAVTMLSRLGGDGSLLPALEKAWEHMVTRRMYVTGGLGSLPVLEGFGNDYELDPEFAYAETCAALAGMFWNWEMSQLTGRPRYGELFEWQMYNAAGVGMGLPGTSYLFNNPLVCRGGVSRKPWYSVPCCPSNISRTWADMAWYIYVEREQGIEIQQYITSEYSGDRLRMGMRSGLPWDGSVRIQLEPEEEREFTIYLRLPSWSLGPRLRVNGNLVDVGESAPDHDLTATAGGYDPRRSRRLTIQRTWHWGDEIELDLDMPVILRRAHNNVKGHAGRAAVTRGPLVYCLESPDNPGIDLFETRVDSHSFHPVFERDLLGGMTRLEGRTSDGRLLNFIPYFLWGNRGESQMNVWIKT